MRGEILHAAYVPVGAKGNDDDGDDDDDYDDDDGGGGGGGDDDDEDDDDDDNLRGWPRIRTPEELLQITYAQQGPKAVMMMMYRAVDVTRRDCP